MDEKVKKIFQKGYYGEGILLHISEEKRDAFSVCRICGFTYSNFEWECPYCREKNY